ncbi:MAG: hypothetical protein AVDCRST_MAG66-2464 [uncultured Pseudonocardia sp.]|uniref:Uncharacterized protein n=1 Tax=uncultured Pseudonocardia sp. TaxID=211455 RepID=A0A6J4PR78_9PSEU|nr:MAG: hypothetical protein AVDCRST_MAG66-2464 [uncultured Pseudonocardia sp.]
MTTRRLGGTGVHGGGGTRLPALSTVLVVHGTDPPPRVWEHPETPLGNRCRSPGSRQRERARQLLQLRIGLAAGLDPLPVLVGLRRHGASGEQIARAAGVSRQSAHERWAGRVTALLSGTGGAGGQNA